MFSKLLILITVFAFAASDEEPRKLYKFDGEKVEVSPFTDPFNGIDYRLHNSTVPIRYDIWLSTEIHKGEFDFEGRVTIEIRVIENTSNITLHYRQLTIVNVDLLSSAGSAIQSNVPTTSHDDVEFLIINPTQELIAGQNYSVVISYLGVLRDDDAGFYRSSYTDDQGQRVWLATTQFESTDARHGFPCYDEPAIRSTYSIQIRHHSNYTAISNMPVASRTAETAPNADYVVTKFEDIPSIQSYLIAFTISDFSYVEDESHFIRQRVFAKPQSILNGEAKLALEVSGKLLEGFEKYLGVNYSLPKMDQAAMPDFAAGAMENWGLVTYRERYLLFDEATGTTRDRENIITTIAHEFAHQWFGNLVSPAWWSFLWLNEGFAALYENHIAHLVFPNERWLDTFLVDTVQPDLEIATRRPMTYYVEDPVRVSSLFDSVAYSKSGSVLRMFQYAFGDSTWSKGLNRYLTDRGMKSAIPDHLYESLQTAVDADYAESSRPNVATVMKSWETQSGYPYVSVTLDENTLNFEQNRFYYTNQTSPLMWWIPVNYYTKSKPDFTSTKADFWIEGTVKTSSFESEAAPKEFKEGDWIVVNTQQSGSYRVNYDDALWKALINQLNANNISHNDIHLFNRAQLIDDSYHFARAGKITFDVPFGIMHYLEKETDYIPWASMNRAYTPLNQWLSGSRITEEYRAFMRKNVDPLFNRLGVNLKNNEPRVDRYARVIAINIACQNRLESCLRQATEKLYNHISANVAIEPELVNAIYCNGIRGANETVFLAVQEKMLASTSGTDKNAMITGLGCTHNFTFVSNHLKLAISETAQLTAEQRSLILSSPMNQGRTSIHAMLDFITENFAAVGTYASIPTMCSNIASRVADEEALEEFESLVDVLMSNGSISEAQATSYKTSAHAILAWHEEHLDTIEVFLKQVAPPEAPTTDAANLFFPSIILLAVASLALKFVM